jgi:hypothetical protein
MRRRYANFWSQAAAGLTALAHTRAASFRWGVLVMLATILVVGGLYSWIEYGWSEAIYRTVGALSMQDDYYDAKDFVLQATRFAGIALPLVTLLFAFSGALGRSLAQTFNLSAAKHVVIAGDSAAALTLALDCRMRWRDAVILIGQGLPEDTALSLRRRGVIVLEGDATQIDTLRTARAQHAAHVVAFEADDTANLQIEAAVRRLLGNARRKPPLGVHVSTRSPMLLREAREMRTAQARRHDGKTPPPIDPKPFSLDEMAARALIQSEAPTLMTLAEKLGHERLHLAFFGFDDAAEAVAARALMSLWSVKFGAPRLTVLTPDPVGAEARFRARHREAFAHPALWSADIAFLPFDWDQASVGAELLDLVESQRGKPVGAVVSTGADPGNIHLSIALKRICNHGLRWPIPIYMKETSQSEFSQQYAKGDDTVELDAYLQAFGSHQVTATRQKVLDGWLDRGAAIAHEYYNKNLGERDPMRLKELQAAMRDWSDVLEAYRSANRAVADSALVKMWDAGFRPAVDKEQGDTAPVIAEAKIDDMARLEHDRWMAERLMSGWRPAAERNNDLMMHNKLAPWVAMNEADRNNDVAQVRAAVDIARVLYPKGFVVRA